MTNVDRIAVVLMSRVHGHRFVRGQHGGLVDAATGDPFWRVVATAVAGLGVVIDPGHEVHGPVANLAGDGGKP